MNQMSNAGRAFALLARRHCASPKVKGRALMGSRTQEVDGQSIALEANSLETEDKDGSISFSALDNRISMHLLRKNFSRPGLGLKSSKNRDNLVLDFFNLSKSVLDNRIQVKEFVASQTFKKLEEQIELNIDFIGNAQIVNLLASVIKMKVNPSTNLVKLLEHEVKFRLKLFNLNQVIKMLKFYNSAELSSEQKQLVDMLSYRVRSFTQSDATTVKDLTAALQSMAAQQAPSSLMASVEESLLNLLTNVSTDDDDMVSKFIPTTKVYDYESLCNLFILLAENRRRPTPLLRAASIELSKLAGTDEAGKPKPEIIISTLNALVSLSYPNRTLISKLIIDLTKVIKFEELDSNSLCNLLRTVGTLRWRPDDLMRMLFDFIKEHGKTCKSIDHHVIVSLLHVAATVNYRPKESLEEFYQQFMKGDREQMLDRNTRKWLNYVWSLVALEIVDEAHIRSVLSGEFYQNITLLSDSPVVNHSDVMKLLNLRAIALYELKLENLNCEHLKPLLGLQIQRGNDVQKLVTKINESLNSIVKSPREIRQTIQTPFGFVVDSELLLDQNLEPIPLEEASVFENGETLQSVTNLISRDDNHTKCALIYVSYEDTVVNYMNEVVGYKQMISRILKNFGYNTVFLPETLLNREKTSADLINRIKTIIKSSLVDVS